MTMEEWSSFLHEGCSVGLSVDLTLHDAPGVKPAPHSLPFGFHHSVAANDCKGNTFLVGRIGKVIKLKDVLKRFGWKICRSSVWIVSFCFYLSHLSHYLSTSPCTYTFPSQFCLINKLESMLLLLGPWFYWCQTFPVNCDFVICVLFQIKQFP